MVLAFSSGVSTSKILRYLGWLKKSSMLALCQIMLATCQNMLETCNCKNMVNHAINILETCYSNYMPNHAINMLKNAIATMQAKPNRLSILKKKNTQVTLTVTTQNTLTMYFKKQ